MLKYNRIYISEGIDVNKTTVSSECDICHYRYSKDIGFNYESYLCNGWHDLMLRFLMMLLLFMLKKELTEFTFGM